MKELPAGAASKITVAIPRAPRRRCRLVAPCACLATALRCLTLLLCNGSNMSLRMTRCRVDSWCSRISHAHSFESDSYLPLVRFLQSWFLRAAGCVVVGAVRARFRVRGKAKESDGRTKRQARRSRSLARARERCSVSQRERREDTQKVFVENLCVTAKLPSSLHEQTRGCHSGVGPRTTLRAAHQPGVGCRPPQGWKATPLPWWPTYLLSKRRRARPHTRPRPRARRTRGRTGLSTIPACVGELPLSRLD